MVYVESRSDSPFINFALEYYLLHERPFPGETVFLFWRTSPTVMVGRYQNTYQEVNLPYVRERGIRVVRRLSGGGAIYTDMGSWQFSFIAPKDSSEVSLARFAEPVAAALRGLGLDVSLSGRNDLVIDGRKFSGNAQHLTRDRVLHHGSILFDTDIGEMVRSTTPDDLKISAKGIKSVRERVTNLAPYLNIGPEEFRDLMISGVTGGAADLVTLTPEETERLGVIANERFDNWQAVYGDSPKGSIIRRKRFPGGGIETHLEVVNGRIAEIRLYGDFFGTADLPALCESLRGCEFREDAVRSRLEGVPLGLRDITADDLASVILP
ncbi:MAG: lipoate--protein ligase [Oscillospiraceae bacterium]|jgi:lipoate-protein ligase A|nr:lipoate--protein ligase [Oscillospiraceae bacterium]